MAYVTHANNKADATLVTVTINPGVVTNAALEVKIVAYDDSFTAAPTIATVTYGGAGASAGVSFAHNTAFRNAIYYKALGTTSSGNVDVVVTAVGASWVAASVTIYSNRDQSTVVRGSGHSTSGSGTPVSIAVTTVSGDDVGDVVADDSVGTYTAGGTNHVERYDIASGSGAIIAMGTMPAVGTTTTPTWTEQTGNLGAWGVAALAFMEAGGGEGPTRPPSQQLLRGVS